MFLAETADFLGLSTVTYVILDIREEGPMRFRFIQLQYLISRKRRCVQRGNSIERLSIAILLPTCCNMLAQPSCKL